MHELAVLLTAGQHRHTSADERADWAAWSVAMAAEGFRLQFKVGVMNMLTQEITWKHNQPVQILFQLHKQKHWEISQRTQFTVQEYDLHMIWWGFFFFF